MSTRFVLVRHATCAQIDSTLLGRAIDAPLDAHGRAQALTLAARLRELDPVLVEASPRLRTLETAQPIAHAVRCELRVSSALDELDFGRWAGQTFASLEADPTWQRWNAVRGSARTPAGETIAAVQVRVLRRIGELARAYDGGSTIVLVTHAEVIRAVLLHLRAMPADKFHRIEVGPASTTFVHATASGLRVDTPDERVAA